MKTARGFVIAMFLAVAAIASAQDRHSLLEQAYSDMLAAQKVLLAAEEAREKGVEPLPGERLGIVKGGSRLGPEYQARQGRLEKDVAAARTRLGQAIARWRSLR